MCKPKESRHASSTTRCESTSQLLRPSHPRACSAGSDAGGVGCQVAKSAEHDARSSGAAAHYDHHDSNSAAISAKHDARSSGAAAYYDHHDPARAGTLLAAAATALQWCEQFIKDDELQSGAGSPESPCAHQWHQQFIAGVTPRDHEFQSVPDVFESDDQFRSEANAFEYRYTDRQHAQFNERATSRKPQSQSGVVGAFGSIAYISGSSRSAGKSRNANPHRQHSSHGR